MNKARRNTRRLIKILAKQYGYEYVQVLSLLALKGTEYFSPEQEELLEISKITLMFNDGYPTNVTFSTQGCPVFTHFWPEITPSGPEK